MTINTQTIIVSNTGTIDEEHISHGGKNKNINDSKINSNNNNNNTHSNSSDFVSLSSLNEALDSKFYQFFGADFVKVLTEKMSSLEAQVKHQGFVLSNLKLELYELRKTNSELSNDLVRLRSLESCSEATNNNFYINSGSDFLGGNTAPNLQIPVIPPSTFLPSSSPSPSPSQILPPLNDTEVVKTGELIITNFIDGEVTDFKKLAHTVWSPWSHPLQIPTLFLHDHFP